MNKKIIFKINQQSQRGNVLFIILIAVALFAALGFAISDGNRTTGQNINADQEKLNAAQIVKECGDLRQRAMSFSISSDIADTSILVNDGTSINNPCRTGTSCLFAAEGGGAIIPIPPQTKGSTNGKFAVPPTPTLYRFYTVSDASFLTGYSSNKSLVIFEAYPLTLSLCNQLNKAAGRSDTTPPLTSTSDPNFRDACYNNGSTTYLFRCPLIR